MLAWIKLPFNLFTLYYVWLWYNIVYATAAAHAIYTFQSIPLYDHCYFTLIHQVY